MSHPGLILMNSQPDPLPLQEVLDLSLVAGLIAHQSGGDTARTSATIRRMHAAGKSVEELAMHFSQSPEKIRSSLSMKS